MSIVRRCGYSASWRRQTPARRSDEKRYTVFIVSFVRSPIAVHLLMQVVITAVGPDNRGLADPIVHSVTGLGANIAEIQMYDHDEERVFSMLTRVELSRRTLRRAL